MRVLAAFLPIFLTAATSTESLEVRAEPAQLAAWVEGLAVHGSDENGTSRVAYTEADIAGRRYVQEQMQSLGLEVRTDAAGNLVGRRAGRDPDAAVILFGSHTDTVPEGGNYDGVAGVVAGLEVIRLLNAAGHTTEHPLELIVFQNEEGGLLGSKGLVGMLGSEELATVSQSGHTIAEGIRRLGGNPDALGQPIYAPRDVAAFVELHIEQGRRLVDTDIAIGIVQGIVGIHWFEIIVDGDANHAGTTPMAGRRDALVTAAKIIQQVQAIGTDTPGTQVATVGRIRAEPGAPNVIPGRVVMSLEIRDLELGIMQQVRETIENAAQRIAKADGTGVTFRANEATQHSPAPTDERMREIIEDAADRLGYASVRLPSMAGHDTQSLESLAPTGMIFVPSQGGYSHSPRELTTAEDLARGADVLLQSILQIDAGALNR